jgi:predicted  nucleic acid-binding Zn-ribbon protein
LLYKRRLAFFFIFSLSELRQLWDRLGPLERTRDENNTIISSLRSSMEELRKGIAEREEALDECRSLVTKLEQELLDVLEEQRRERELEKEQSEQNAGMLIFLRRAFLFDLFCS